MRRFLLAINLQTESAAAWDLTFVFIPEQINPAVGPDGCKNICNDNRDIGSLLCVPLLVSCAIVHQMTKFTLNVAIPQNIVGAAAAQSVEEAANWKSKRWHFHT